MKVVDHNDATKRFEHIESVSGASVEMSFPGKGREPRGPLGERYSCAAILEE